ncbi:hypothetical protein FQR65_LT17127 [Abscondita terminalis]|nr:hypothetical protein FQR65_LT17127 [Abscondita terminalis]
MLGVSTRPHLVLGVSKFPHYKTCTALKCVKPGLFFCSVAKFSNSYGLKHNNSVGPKKTHSVLDVSSFTGISMAKKTVQLMEDLETAVGKSNLPYKQVELFSLQVYVENFKFSVFGYFPLDWTLLHSMVAGVATYLVIFHQFSNMEKNV